MADLNDTPSLPPLLKKLKGCPPGDLYALAAKDNLITGALERWSISASMNNFCGMLP